VNIKLYKALCLVLVVIGIALSIKGMGSQQFNLFTGAGLIIVGLYYFFRGKPTA